MGRRALRLGSVCSGSAGTRTAARERCGLPLARPPVGGAALSLQPPPQPPPGPLRVPGGATAAAAGSSMRTEPGPGHGDPQHHGPGQPSCPSPLPPSRAPRYRHASPGMCGLGWARARGSRSSRPAPCRAPLNRAGVLGDLATGGGTAGARSSQNPQSGAPPRTPPPSNLGAPPPPPPHRFRSGSSPLSDCRFSLQPPLVQAIFSRDVEEVRSLLSQKENINVLVSWEQGGWRDRNPGSRVLDPSPPVGRLRVSSAQMRPQFFPSWSESLLCIWGWRAGQACSPDHLGWGCPGTLFSSEPPESAAPPPLLEKGAGFSAHWP